MRSPSLIILGCIWVTGCSRSDTATAPTTAPATAPSAIDRIHPATQQSRTNLTLDDFHALRPDMTVEQVQERLGTPRRDIGSGIYILEYELVSGEKVWVGSSGQNVLYVRYREQNLPFGGS